MEQIIATAVVGLVSAGAGMWVAWTQLPKIRAEAATSTATAHKIHTDIDLSIIEPLRNELNEQRRRRMELADRVNQLEHWLHTTDVLVLRLLERLDTNHKDSLEDFNGILQEWRLRKGSPPGDMPPFAP